jgi:hypothetical protein
MKKALLILAAMAMGASAFAQGTITFFNNNLTGATGTYRAGIFRPDGAGAGAGYTVGLFLASNLDTPLATATFRTTTAQEVFATAQDVVITGSIAGTTPSLVVRAWETAAGSFANSTIRGEQAFTSRPLGGQPDPQTPPIATPDMGPGFTGFTMVPEPSTIALGALGIGALLLRRRK